MESHQIPILFLQDDYALLEMYREFLEAKGYDPIVIRGGKGALEYAIAETPSLLTLKARKNASLKNRSPIFIFTQCCTINQKFDLKSAVISSEVFSQLNKLENLSSAT